MKSKAATKISVIGAGFAGMTVALRLAQKGFEVDLYENSSRVGGLLGTDKTSYGIAERAANALICTERSLALFSELQLIPSIPLKTAKKRYLFRDHPRQWPLSIIETLAFIAKFLPRLLLKGRKSLSPHAGETLQSWGLRNLGQAPTQFILGPAMQGVYGNEISGLSASLILGPLFLKRKKEKYKGLLTSPGGMQDLVDELEKKLRALGVRIHLNAAPQVEELETPVVIATSAPSACNLLKESYPSLSQSLGRVQMSSLLSVTMFFKNAQQNYKGFGCLIPREYGLKSLGVLMNSYIFKDRNQTYSETWMLGGINEANLLDLSDTQIIDLISEERFKILGQKETPLDCRINRWKNALPYYDLVLENEVKTISKLQKRYKNIYLHGNYIAGIGLSKILERSELLAQEIATNFGEQQ